MKRIILFLYSSFFILHSSFSQVPGQWVWLHGSNTVNSPGNFGSKGVPSATNVPPAYYETGEGTAPNGIFWMYGGVDYSYLTHNDLWKYDPSSNQWTWVSGTQAAND